MADSVQLVAQLGGELVTYQPWNGTPKTFKAIVERRPTQLGIVSGVAFPENSLEVFIPNDATDGVTTITKGKDKITFKRNLSDSQETEFIVAAILQEDAGLVASDAGGFTVLVK